MKKKKNSLTNVLIVLLLIVGVGVIGYPTICDLYYKWEVSREIAQYNQVAEAEKKDYSALWAAAEEYNRQLAESNHFSVTVSAEQTEYISQLLNPLGTGMMGYVDIPSINVHIPLYQGTDESVLQSGAGHWLGTSLPTGGENTHCVITAHNGLVKAKLFTDLDKVKEGDTFTLSILDRVLTYEVDQVLITAPDDFEPMKIVEGEDLCTLYTCYPYGVNTHRLLVRGHRVEEVIETIDANEENNALSDGGEKVSENNLLILILIVLVSFIFVLTLVLLIYEKYRYKGRHERSKRKLNRRR